MTPPPVLVLHTTQGSSISGAVATMNKNRSWSHKVYDPLIDKGQMLLPWSSPARSLVNLPGGEETNNRVGPVYQLEIVGFAETIPFKGDIWYQNLANEIIRICESLGIAREFPCESKPYPASYGADNGVRMTLPQWADCGGIVGHLNIPENVHGDPGDLFPKLKPLVIVPINVRIDRMPATISLTDCQNYVRESYALAKNDDPAGQRWWTRKAAAAPDPIVVLADMDTQLKLG